MRSRRGRRGLGGRRSVGDSGDRLPLRRRTSRLLALALVVTVVPALVGAGWVVACAPEVRAPALLIAPLLLVLCVMLCDGSWVFAAIVTALLEAYGLAAACLHKLLGVPKLAAALVPFGGLLLIGAILMRALIASGSADDPYAEDE